MNYKMLVLDLDDTLLNDQLEISDANKRAIELIKNKGVKVVFCTGRPTKAIQKYVLNSFFHRDDYHIVYNGARITNLNQHILFDKMITGNTLYELVKIGRSHHVDVQLYRDDELIVERYTPLTQRYESLSGMKAQLVEDLSKEGTTAKVLFNEDDEEQLMRIKKQIEDRFSNELTTFFSKSFYLEVLHKEASKGLALKHLAHYYKIQPEEIVAVGDSYNDMTMIEYAGMGICVKNGREAVKQQANYVTSKTNNEDAICEVIEKFF